VLQAFAKIDQWDTSFKLGNHMHPAMLNPISTVIYLWFVYGTKMIISCPKVRGFNPWGYVYQCCPLSGFRSQISVKVHHTTAILCYRNLKKTMRRQLIDCQGCALKLP
jgi:hypothetical protein